MRQLIRTYTITGLHEITITGYTFTKEDVRLVIDETLAITDKRASVLVSSTAKNNIVSVVSGVITLANTTAALTAGDELTIEIDIDNIAKEANATANKNAIINAINNIDLSTVAKESAATANKEAIIAAINSAEPDLSSVAKETSVKDGNDTAVSVGKEVRSEVGTGSDTAAESGTLFAVVKWIKDKVKSIYNLVGTPASGQPSTLFAAIAAGGGGGDAQESTSQEILSRIGSAGSGQSATLFGAVGDIALSATTLQSLADSWEEEVEHRKSLDGVEVVSPYIIENVTDLILKFNKIKSIIDNTTEVATIYWSQFYSLEHLELNALQSIDSSVSINCFRGVASLQYISLGLTNVNYYNFILECDELRNVEFPNATYVGGNAMLYWCPKLEELHFPKVTNLGSLSLGESQKLILIELGPIQNSFSLASWNPTVALDENSQTLLSQDDLDAGFTSNLQKLLYNIREHIAANLPVAQNTITFSANIKAAIQAETSQATAAAFTNKGWTIA